MANQNVQKFREPIMAPDFLKTDGTVLGGGGSTPATAAVGQGPFVIQDNTAAIQRLRITFDAYQADILAVNDFVSIYVAEMGDRFYTLGVESELDFVKDGTGILTTGVFDVAMSSVAAISASFTTLANSDVMLKEDVNGIGDQLDYAFNQFVVLSGNTVTGYPRASIGTGLYFNVQTSILVDGHVTLTGWVDVYYIDLGVAA
tara:strand:+ start:23637 stop:24242 length:606 start_codon:yes stop_codon:yes gene_type:complete